MVVSLKLLKAVGYICLLICIVTWSAELLDLVYVCPYCRVQRTVIGLVGIIMISPWFNHWIAKYIAIVLSAFGFFVAASQHFMAWKKISSGDFVWVQNLFLNPMILSAVAMFILVAQIGILFNYQKKISQ